MKFGSLFTGIGGFDLAFEQAGMTCAWQCEINAAARSVLTRHWPDVPVIEDVKNVGRHSTEPVDLICGGFPCQDLSVAGKRAGLAGERSGLWFEFHRIVDELRPKWVVVENVPGLLSSNRGADFAVILQGLVELRYGVTWRVLDAQYFGVAQRRRRVFIVGSLGDGRSAEVLFEREGLFGHPPALRATGQGVTGSLAAGAHASGFNGRDAERGNIVSAPLGAHHRRDDLDNDTYIVGEPLSFDWQTAGSERTYIHDQPGATRSLSASKTLAVAFGGNNTSGEIDIATAVNAAPTRRYDFESETFVAYNIQHNDGGQHKRKDRPEGGLYVNETNTALTVGTTDLTAVVAFTQNSRDEVRQIGGDGQIAGALGAQPGMKQQNYVAFGVSNDPSPKWAEDVMPPLQSKNGVDTKSGGRMESVATTSGVRRLTPMECTRLQGFPDDWQEVSDADETQAHAREVLHGMWREVGAKNREGWRLRIALALLTPEVLLAGVHGGWVSWEMATRSATASREIQGEDTWPEGFLCALWQANEDRPSPYRRQSFEQFARELGRPLQELPLEGSQARAYLLGSELWPQASQEWPLRYAQSESETRLNTVLSDSARYRQLGNAVAVPVARWIGARIMAIESQGAT